MQEGMLVRVEDVVKRYQEFCLDHITFSLKQGTITGLVGKNGAGKSTMLKIIRGLIRPDRGYVDIANQERPVGYLGMEKQIYTEQKLKQIARFVGQAWGKQWDWKRYTYYCKEMFQLDENKKIKQLSTGMAVKFLLALELAKKPSLLLLDEPTSGLDPLARKEVLKILQKLAREENVTILFSTHMIEDLQKIADRVLYIVDGRMTEGSTDQVDLMLKGEEDVSVDKKRL